MGIITSALVHLISFSGLDFFHDLLPHGIPISPSNCIFRDLVYMQTAPKRQSQLLKINHCLSKSDANFMQIASRNMYINLALTLRVWSWVLWGLTNQIETKSRNCGRKWGSKILFKYKIQILFGNTTQTKLCMTDYILEVVDLWI